MFKKINEFIGGIFLAIESIWEIFERIMGWYILTFIGLLVLSFILSLINEGLACIVVLLPIGMFKLGIIPFILYCVINSIIDPDEYIVIKKR